MSCSLIHVGQIVNLRPIGNRPVNEFGIIYGPINNRPQVTNLPHKNLLPEVGVVERGRQLLLDAIHCFLG